MADPTKPPETSPIDFASILPALYQQGGAKPSKLADLIAKNQWSKGIVGGQPARGLPGVALPPGATPPSPAGGAAGGQGKKAPTEAQVMADFALRRIVTGDSSGWGGALDPGVVTGAALRKDVRDAFEKYGGVTGVYIGNMSPEEKRRMLLLLDPVWVQQHPDWDKQQQPDQAPPPPTTPPG